MRFYLGYCTLSCWVAVAQEEECFVNLSEGWWFDPGFFSLHDEVSINQILVPKLLLMAISSCRNACECVYE